MAILIPEDPSPDDENQESSDLNQFPREESLAEDFSASDLSTDDLEAAYLRALEAMESEDWAIDPDSESEVESQEFTDDSDDSVKHPSESHVASSVAPVGDTSSEAAREVHEFVADSEKSQSRAEISILSPSSSTEIAGADFLSARISEPGTDHEVARISSQKQVTEQPTTPFGSHFSQEPAKESARKIAEQQPLPNATRIIEACLFVGGQPLSAKRLATLLESTGEPSYLEQLVDDLNLEYASQQRPYEIRLGDGGYRMALRTEFEAVRNRVYGVGPRDVKLSQDVLEVLALVAYQQPIAHSAVEACGKPNVANILRQLLRRELITLVRIDQTRNGVEYRTSPRFLQVFGLGNLNELPRPEDLAIR